MNCKYAEVVKLADTPALGAGALKSVRVQIPPSAQNKKHEFIKSRVFLVSTHYQLQTSLSHLYVYFVF